MPVLACAEVDEIEIGWGNRPDGIFLFSEQSQLDEFKQKLENGRKEHPQEFSTVGNVRSAKVSDAIAQEVEESGGSKWILQHRYRDYKKSGEIKVFK